MTDVNRDLTILLTLKDRGAFTFRWMSYLNSVHFPFKVLIADGGADERVARALADRTACPHVSYDYLRYPYDASYADYYAKIDDAVSRVRTPFVALADNDDFFIVSGLREAVRFLINHPDYATCGGQCAVFWIGRGHETASHEDDVLYGRHVVWKCSGDAQSLAADTARARIRGQSLRSTYPIYYHVQRTEDLSRHFHLVRELNPKDLLLLEYFLSFLIAIAGKTKQLDTLYIARQWNAPASAGGAHVEKYGDCFGRMLVPSWSDDFTNFVTVTAAALAERDDIAFAEARASIVEAYRMLTAPMLLSDVVKEPAVTLSTSVLVRIVRRLLTLPADSVVRRLARTLYRRAGWVSAEAVHGTELWARPVSNAAREFGPICEFLTRRAGSAIGLSDGPGRPIDLSPQPQAAGRKPLTKQWS